MKQTTTRLILAVIVLSLASCTIEKRVYSNGYYVSWLQTNNIDATQDASQELSQNLPKDLSENLSSNLPKDLSKNLEIQTPSDTITPTNKQEDYFGDKVHKPSKEKIRPYFQRPIKRPKTIEDLKLAIRFDFRLALASILVLAFAGGLLYLGQLLLYTNLTVGVFLYLAAIGSVFTFLFYLFRGFLRTIKLAILKLFGKSDEAKINKRRKRRIRESEHQIFRRILLGIGKFFRFILQPKSFGSKVLLYLFALLLGGLIIGLSQ